MNKLAFMKNCPGVHIVAKLDPGLFGEAVLLYICFKKQ